MSVLLPARVAGMAGGTGALAGHPARPSGIDGPTQAGGRGNARGVNGKAREHCDGMPHARHPCQLVPYLLSRAPGRARRTSETDETRQRAGSRSPARARPPNVVPCCEYGVLTPDARDPGRPSHERVTKARLATNAPRPHPACRSAPPGPPAPRTGRGIATQPIARNEGPAARIP